jgi:hypothetical protein
MDDLVTLGCGRDQRPGLLICDRDKDVSRPVGQADDEPVVVAIEMKNNCRLYTLAEVADCFA